MQTLLISGSHFWAKLNDARTGWHSLAGHSADVGAVFERLVSPGSVLAARLAATAGLRELPDELRAWLVRLACLHDVGKANRIFQSKKNLPPRTYVPLGGHVKVVIDTALGDPPKYKKPFGRILQALRAELDGDDAAARRWFRTAVAHHGRPWGAPAVTSDRLWRRCWAPGDGLDPPAEVRRLLELSARWSGADASTPVPGGIPTDPAFTHLFAGILTLADWIGSTETGDAFPLRGDIEAGKEDAYWADARERAGRACALIGVVPTTRPVSVDLTGLPLLERIFPRLFAADVEREPTPLQRAVSSMPLPAPGGSVLIESETGSGKTEAVLALYARMRAAGLVGGLFFALPTRATARAMHKRVEKALAGIYPGGDRPTVALAVGGLSQEFGVTEDAGAAGETRANPLAGAARTYDDDVEADPDSVLARWAASQAKKFLAAEIVVGTVDQGLLAGLPVRHAHLRLAGLARHLWVVDELHSFDRYMNRVMVRLLEMHLGAGGCAAFMSATLSAAARAELAEPGSDPEPFGDAVAAPYPALWTRPHGGTWEPGWSGTSDGDGKPVRWEAVDEARALAEAVEAARRGARVCILRNTVEDARRTLKALGAGDHGDAADLLWRPRPGGEPAPYHSRYAKPDREAMDRDVTDRFGKDAAAATGGCLLVATQVVEQSLDVDFDLLVTDLCPVDALLQRVGRLHRHRERDPHRPDGYRTARVLVIAPADGFARYAREPKEPGQRKAGHGWGTVYDNLGDLELTLRLIRDPARPSIVIPRDNRALVEAVYHRERREALETDEGEDWESYGWQMEGKWRAQDQFADDTRIVFDHGYASAEVVRRFDAAWEARVRTRLGDDTVRVELDEPVRGRHSDGTASHVDVPVRLLSSGGAEESGADPARTGVETAKTIVSHDGVQRYRVGETVVEYRIDGWSWGATRPSPDGGERTE